MECAYEKKAMRFFLVVVMGCRTWEVNAKFNVKKLVRAWLIMKKRSLGRSQWALPQTGQLKDFQESIGHNEGQKINLENKKTTN